MTKRRKSQPRTATARGCPPAPPLPAAPTRAKDTRVHTPDRVLEGIVQDYIARCRDDTVADLEFYCDGSLEDAITKAALARWRRGRKHPHQNLIKPATLQAARRRLLRIAGELGRCPDFAALHERIKQSIGTIRGIGDLAVYDIANRIGAYLDKEPELVYLHRGTRLGAAKLGFRGATINPRDLPRAFDRLSPAHVEDCLCIFEDQLPDRRPLHKRRRRRSSPGS